MSNNNVWGGCIRSYILCKLYFYSFSTSWDYVVVMNGVIRPYHRRGFLCLASPYNSTIIIIKCQTVRITMGKNLSWTLKDSPILRYYTKHTRVRWRVEYYSVSYHEKATGMVKNKLIYLSRYQYIALQQHISLLLTHCLYYSHATPSTLMLYTHLHHVFLT